MIRIRIPETKLELAVVREELAGQKSEMQKMVRAESDQWISGTVCLMVTSGNRRCTGNPAEINRGGFVCTGQVRKIVMECLKEQVSIRFSGIRAVMIPEYIRMSYKQQGEIHHVLTSREQGRPAADGCPVLPEKSGSLSGYQRPRRYQSGNGIKPLPIWIPSPQAFITTRPASLLGKDSFQEVILQG